MDIANEMEGLRASLEYAARMVQQLVADNGGWDIRRGDGASSELCMRLDMVKDYLNLANRRISDIEGTMRYSYAEDLNAVLKSLDF